MEKEWITAVGLALGVPTLIQISPLKLRPWGWLGRLVRLLWRGFCRSLNAEVLEKLSAVEKEQKDTRKKLEEHIRLDDRREADKVRSGILRFNNELLRDIPHTREEYVEILGAIDRYNRFCAADRDYKNSRAVHAIANIERMYDQRLEKHDFL